MAFLQGPSLKQEEVIKQELGEGPGDLERGVQDLRSMLAASPYLPEPDTVDTNVLQCFVRGCRMDMERARSKLEAFCFARTRHRDLFEHRSLSEPPLNDVCNFMDIATLPKLTDEGFRVTIFRIKPGYPDDSSDIAAVVKAILLLSDARMKDEHLISGDVFVYEVSGGRGPLVGRVAAAASTIRRGIQLAHTAFPQRLKRIHVVGTSPFLASSLQLMRNCVTEKIRKRYYLHTKLEELLEHIPTRVLPAEWGGEEESIDIIAKKWRRRVDESRDFLRRMNEMGSKVVAPIIDADIYGTVGAFRKLDID